MACRPPNSATARPPLTWDLLWAKRHLGTGRIAQWVRRRRKKKKKKRQEGKKKKDKKEKKDVVLFPFFPLPTPSLSLSLSPPCLPFHQFTPLPSVPDAVSSFPRNTAPLSPAPQLPSPPFFPSTFRRFRTELSWQLSQRIRSHYGVYRSIYVPWSSRINRFDPSAQTVRSLWVSELKVLAHGLHSLWRRRLYTGREAAREGTDNSWRLVVSRFPPLFSRRSIHQYECKWKMTGKATETGQGVRGRRREGAGGGRLVGRGVRRGRQESFCFSSRAYEGQIRLAWGVNVLSYITDTSAPVRSSHTCDAYL